MGRIVIEPNVPAARAAVATAFRYLWRSPTARRLLRLYQRQGGRIVIDLDALSSESCGGTGNIIWNPIGGTGLPDGSVDSSALALLHEISHATHFYHRDDLAREDTRQRLALDMATMLWGPGKVLAATHGRWTPEEERATHIEAQVARELGEAQRKHYAEGTPASTLGPTDHIVKG